MFGGLGMTEIMLLVVVFLLVFGAKRLPEIGSAMGKGIREFKKSMREVTDEIDRPATPAATSAPAEPRRLPSDSDKQRLS